MFAGSRKEREAKKKEMKMNADANAWLEVDICTFGAGPWHSLNHSGCAPWPVVNHRCGV